MDKTVLVLDENPIVHRVIATALEGGAVAVHHEFNPSRFLEKAQSILPNVILLSALDYDTEFSMHSRFAKAEKLKNIPRVALLSPKTPLDENLKKSLSLSGILLKPLEVSQVQQEITKQLKVNFQTPDDLSEIRLQAVGDIMDEEVSKMLESVGAPLPTDPQAPPPQAPPPQVSQLPTEDVYQLGTEEMEVPPITTPPDFAPASTANTGNLPNSVIVPEGVQAPVMPVGVLPDSIPDSIPDNVPDNVPDKAIDKVTDKVTDNVMPVVSSVGEKSKAVIRSVPAFKADPLTPDEKPMDEAFPYLPHVYESQFGRAPARVIIFPEKTMNQDKTRSLLHLKPVNPPRPSVLPIKSSDGQPWITPTTNVPAGVLDRAFEEARKLKDEEPQAEEPKKSATSKDALKDALEYTLEYTLEDTHPIPPETPAATFNPFGTDTGKTEEKNEENTENVASTGSTGSTASDAEDGEEEDDTDFQTQPAALAALKTPKTEDIKVEQFKETVLRPLSKDEESLVAPTTEADDQFYDSAEVQKTDISSSVEASESVGKPEVVGKPEAVGNPEAVRIDGSQLTLEDEEQGHEEFILLGVEEDDDLIELSISQIKNVTAKGDIFPHKEIIEAEEVTEVVAEEVAEVDSPETTGNNSSPTSEEEPLDLDPPEAERMISVSGDKGETYEAVVKEAGLEGTILDEAGLDEAVVGEAGLEGAGSEGAGSEGAGSEGAGLDEAGLDEADLDELSQDGEISETASLANYLLPKDSELLTGVLDDIISQSIDDAMQAQESNILELEKGEG